MGFFIDDLLADEARRVTVILPVGEISGVLAQDVTFSGSATYTIGQSTGAGWMSGISKAVNLVKHLANIDDNYRPSWSLFPPVHAAQSKLTTPIEMDPTWSEDSGSFGFHVSIMQLSGSEKSVQGSSIGNALKAILPEVGNGWEQTAPMGYAKGKGGNASVQIGTWFRSSSDLVVTHVSSSAGRELDGDGNPLYLIINMGFMQAGPLDADFIAGWFP